MLFILFLIFSSIGCIYEYTPDDDVVLNKEHPSQIFTITTMSSEIWWKINDVTVETDNIPSDNEWISKYTLNLIDLNPGVYKLSAHTSEEIIEWTVTVSYDIEREINIEQKELHTWNDVRNEWEEKSNKLMNGEEI